MRSKFDIYVFIEMQLPSLAWLETQEQNVQTCYTSHWPRGWTLALTFTTLRYDNKLMHTYSVITGTKDVDNLNIPLGLLKNSNLLVSHLWSRGIY